MAEFRLYFSDADEAHAAQQRIEQATNLFSGLFGAPVAIKVVWPVSFNSTENEDGETVVSPVGDVTYELILDAPSMSLIEAILAGGEAKSDLDYTWEGGG
jgi:hypothetical protein